MTCENAPCTAAPHTRTRPPACRFNAVERMLEYQRVPQESAREVPEHKPPPEWPGEGVVEYRDVWLRYREGLPPVLKVCDGSR